MNDFEFKIEKRHNCYKLIGGIKSEISPTRWSNLEIEFSTKEELMDYVILKTKKIISKVK